MKSVTVYKLGAGNESFFSDIKADLQVDLERQRFQPTQKLQPVSHGFINNSAGELASKIMGVWHFVWQEEQKILPASVVNDEIKERIEYIADTESRKVARKERETIREAILAEYLPRAFTKRKQVPVFISGDRLYIGTSTTSQAECICSTIREALGSLPVVPLNNAVDLNLWLSSGAGHESVSVTEKIKLVHTKTDAKSSHSNLCLDGDEVRSCIESGMRVAELGIDAENAFSATINDSAQLKSIKFSDDLPGIDECDNWESIAILHADAITQFYNQISSK